ncbi:hypothetical protein EYF80_005672 [Liparis tanakae]|uniref:Uncharacterized protein n=1 Tax=Liparis tanakae TaxID=230148 RepID=A0A4Z2J1L0_9TELE|nr:hypothetical protein EYF80_005672 [Liparis tanakae]
MNSNPIGKKLEKRHKKKSRGNLNNFIKLAAALLSSLMVKMWFLMIWPSSPMLLRASPMTKEDKTRPNVLVPST